MAKTWNSFKDVDRAVHTITKLFEETGTIPSRLVKAYCDTLDESATKGMIRRFYEELTNTNPEAARLFVALETKKTPNAGSS